MPPPTASKHHAHATDLSLELLPYLLVFMIGVCFVLFGYARRKKIILCLDIREYNISYLGPDYYNDYFAADVMPQHEADRQGRKEKE